ncbi:hypothetical protein NIES4071_36840 [Calothrix sp. NIES-4071]|nr:hypothetical protein NIES4071_36840 [Calothrix sp. NIES-4071]BAZ58003.1 hypothetical protein NIES4105_36770 [Calothrix sp. NIES-4105]
MGKQTVAQHTPTTSLLSQGVILQRKCASCGQYTVAGGECEGCKKKRNTLIQPARDSAASSPYTPFLPTSSFNYDFSRVPAQTNKMTELEMSQIDDPEEQEAEHIANKVVHTLSSLNQAGVLASGSISKTSPKIQRAVANDRGIATSPRQASASLLVEDDAETVEAGQMRKSEFLTLLHVEVCTAADAALAPTKRSTEGCPYLDFWFGYYGNRTSQQLEYALRRYAPEAASATNARAYIPVVVERVRHAVTVWAATGEVTGVPEGISTGMPDTTTLPQAAESPTSLDTSNIQFKGHEGSSPITTTSPQVIQSQLGAGQPLNVGTRQQMESAFGYNFAGVRIHTDAKAASMATNLNARAFTIGNNIAFGRGEYQPGTLIGDVLIAHELAHTIQQGSAVANPISKDLTDSTNDTELEEAADESAIQAVATLWGGVKQFVGKIVKKAKPNLKAKLRLQRCGGGRCPEGYSWQVVNTGAVASGCVCTWRCLQAPSSGPAFIDPNRRPLVILPEPRQGPGVTSGGLSSPLQCNCLPLKDDEGNRVSSSQSRPVDQDFTGAVAGAAGMRRTTPPPLATDQSPIAAPVRPAVPRAAGATTGGGATSGGTTGGGTTSSGGTTGGGTTGGGTIGSGRTGGIPGQGTTGTRTSTSTSSRGRPQPTVIRPGTTPRGASPQTTPTRTLSSATTTDTSRLRDEGFVQHGMSGDARSVFYRHPDTGETVQITLRQGGPLWINPIWGRSRIESELRDRSFRFERPTSGEGGQIYRNSTTGEEIRIMPRPGTTYRDEPIEKHLNSYYYRYRSGPDQPWGDHTTIIDRD